LYNLRGSSLHMIRLIALTQGTCPGDFRMARLLSSDLLFLYINFGKKHQLYESTFQKSFDRFRCKFEFVQLERVFIAHETA
jgi:hypothetical protein